MKTMMMRGIVDYLLLIRMGMIIDLDSGDGLTRRCENDRQGIERNTTVQST